MAASVVNVVDQIWHTDQISPSTEALTVAQGISATLLVGLTVILSWFARPFVEAAPPS